MSEVRILVGIPGSGKTTYARYLERFEGYVRFSQDEAVRIPHPLGIKARIFQTISESVEKGKNVVIDGTYIQRYQRSDIIDFCKGIDAEVVVCVFKSNLKDCINHNESKSERNKPSEEIIRQMKNKFENPAKKKCKRIETIDSDEWFKEHSKQVELINSFDYERKLHDQINAIRLSNMR